MLRKYNAEEMSRIILNQEPDDLSLNQRNALADDHFDPVLFCLYRMEAKGRNFLKKGKKNYSIFHQEYAIQGIDAA